MSTAEKERLKTNIKKHIVYISESNYKDVIKIVKLWRTRNNLRIKTFVLEILVVETLNDEKGLSLSEATICVLNNIYENIRSLKLVDPANSNNVLSDILSPSDKTLFSNKAKEALDIINDSSIDRVEKWKMVLQYPFSSDQSRSAPAVCIKREPVGSWCSDVNRNDQ